MNIFAARRYPSQRFELAGLAGASRPRWPLSLPRTCLEFLKVRRGLAPSPGPCARGRSPLDSRLSARAGLWLRTFPAPERIVSRTATKVLSTMRAQRWQSRYALRPAARTPSRSLRWQLPGCAAAIRWPPSWPWPGSEFPRPAKSHELHSPGALTPSAGRGTPPRQLMALGWPPWRLTRRPSLHSRSLHYATAGRNPEPLPPVATGSRSIPLPSAMGSQAPSQLDAEGSEGGEQAPV